MLTGLVNVPLIVVGTPLAETPPVIPPVTVGAGQLYVVPAGTMPLIPSVGVALNGRVLPVPTVIALIDTPGLTVTVIAKTLPAQLPDNGVTK
jgi:hypothetical protein